MPLPMQIVDDDDYTTALTTPSEEAPRPAVPAQTPSQSGGNGAPEGDPLEVKPQPHPPGLPPARESGAPDWAIVPSGLMVPRGRQVVFLRFPPSITNDMTKGERQAICWSLSDAEEKIASDRCGGNAGRSAIEYPKQMIRAVDGVVVNWSKPRGPGSVDEFYREIGPKGRNLLARIYTSLHMTTEQELRDFFESCVDVRTAGLGGRSTGGSPTRTWCERPCGRCAGTGATRTWRRTTR